MEIPVIKIGNSKAKRLSKLSWKKYDIKDKLQMVFEKGQIILRLMDNPRKNWEEAFKK